MVAIAASLLSDSSVHTTRRITPNQFIVAVTNSKVDEGNLDRSEADFRYELKALENTMRDPNDAER